VLLDEPTSNLDALNEGAVLKALDAQRGKRTVLLVSHRPSSLAIADEVISLDQGRVS
jgi:ABC-type bacteriocin/lantibiotic exporter with double-glycine peptidase domain